MRTFQVTIEESVYEMLEQIGARVRRPPQWQAEMMLVEAITSVFETLPEVPPGDLPSVRGLPQPARVMARKGGRDGQA